VKPETTNDLFARFEATVHVAENGAEFWLARELAELLGYVQWRNIAEVLGRRSAGPARWCFRNGDFGGGLSSDLRAAVMGARR